MGISYFRECIREEGYIELFKLSVELYGEKTLEPEVFLDTTVQEKAIPFPTDAKILFKIIGKCLNRAWAEEIQLCEPFGVNCERAHGQFVFLGSNHVQVQRKAPERAIANMATEVALMLMEHLSVFPIHLPALPIRSKKCRDFARHCVIEPVIGHVKFDFRMVRNYLKGVLGGVVNPFLTVTASISGNGCWPVCPLGGALHSV